jgi:ribosomal protein S18 acetylase RimI-like enzyme
MYYEALLREAEPEDAKVLAEFSARVFYESFIEQNNPTDMQAYIDEAFTEARMLEEIQSADSQFFLVFSPENELMGFAKIIVGREIPVEIAQYKIIELQRIYVDKRFQDRKVGKLLMQKCLKTAQNQGFEILWLGVWEHNEKALNFYRAWGFEVFGSHIFQLGSDAQTDLLMKKSLR